MVRLNPFADEQFAAVDGELKACAIDDPDCEACQ